MVKGGEMEQLKRIMYELRITQSEIASKIGVNQQTISGCLGRRMSAERFIEICEAMGCEVIVRKGEKEWQI